MAKSPLPRRRVGALVAAAATVSVLLPARASAFGAPAQVRAPKPAFKRACKKDVPSDCRNNPNPDAAADISRSPALAS